ncbi:glycosyltransferase family 2 protein [Gordonia sp. NPDC003425]
MTTPTGAVTTVVVEPVTDVPHDLDLWPGAVWVGQIEQDTLTVDALDLVDGRRFTTARLLIRRSGTPVGFLEVPIVDGLVDTTDLRDRAHALPAVPATAPAAPAPAISVVICTRDRPDHLRTMLASLDVLDYPEFEVVVVDNNPPSGLTAAVVDEHVGVPVRVVDAPGQGLSVARNTGLRAAAHPIVAFTDDDVVVDAHWLTNIAAGFARDPRVACVCGMVPTSELLTPAQSYFDRRVGWAQHWAPATYDLREQLDDDLFPLHVSQFGTGANFAVRRDVAMQLGGFDEALGAGAPTGSGEDMDMFVRVLLSDHVLVREPSALIWHSHRRTAGELDAQLYNYAVGLTALMWKLVLRPRTALLVMRRVPAGFRHMRSVIVVDDAAARTADPALDHVTDREREGFLRGPWALMRARWAGRIAAPLKTPATALGRRLDIRHQTMWGDPPGPVVQAQMTSIAFVFGVLGLLGALPALPGAIRAVATLALVLLGPGALILSFYPRLPGYARAALIPVTGVAITILAVNLPLLLGVYRPTATMLVLAGVTAAGALLRRFWLSERAGRVAT